MFGIFRFILAFMVVFQHLGGLPAVGAYAVFGFYALSGYLMTLVMQRTYTYSLAGIGRYLSNRWLRIYPLYLISILLTLLLIAVFSEGAVMAFKDNMVMPSGTGEWAANLLIFYPYGTDFFSGARLTPPAWALTVELVYYAAIGLGLSANRRITWAWFGLGLIYHVVLVLQPNTWNLRYFTIAGASLPFAAGALLYHYRDLLLTPSVILSQRRLGGLIIGLGVGLVLNWGVAGLLGVSETFGFYLNFLLCTVMIGLLLGFKPSTPLLATWDQRAGDMSYPIYLMHYQVGVLVMVLAALVGWEFERKTTSFVLVVFIPLCALAWGSHVVVEQRLERFRTRIRNRAQQGQRAAPALGFEYTVYKK